MVSRNSEARPAVAMVVNEPTDCADDERDQHQSHVTVHAQNDSIQCMRDGGRAAGTVRTMSTLADADTVAGRIVTA